jgi:hypothetical protein
MQTISAKNFARMHRLTVLERSVMLLCAAFGIGVIVFLGWLGLCYTAELSRLPIIGQVALMALDLSAVCVVFIAGGLGLTGDRY